MASDKRHRMVVEEVGEESTNPLGEIKEKVEELHEVTQDLNDDVAKAEEVQEEIAEAVEVIDKSVTAEDDEIEVEDVPNDEPVSETVDEPETHSVHTNYEHTEESHSDHGVSHMHSQDSNDDMPQIKNPSTTNPLIVIVPGLFLLGALLGGIYFYQRGLTLPPSESPVPSVVETIATTAPVASPAATNVDLTKYPVSVLNGSGITGEAGRLKTSLTAAGFTVSATGNATSNDFTKTIIKAKADVPEAFLTKLTETLGKTYELDKNQVLPASSSDMVQVVVGSTKK